MSKEDEKSKPKLKQKPERKYYVPIYNKDLKKEGKKDASVRLQGREEEGRKEEGRQGRKKVAS